jgi:hypothetical protein
MTTLVLASQRANARFDSEAVSAHIDRLSYADVTTLSDALTGEMTRTLRAQIRYLAALFPEMTLNQAADTIAWVINNRNLYPRDVRLILDARSMADPSRHTNEVPFAAIQTVGRVLVSGGTRVTAARASGLSIDTVVAIDDYLGMSQAWYDRAIETAIAGMREGWSVRKVAAVLGVSKSTAHRLMVRARDVLVELGEVTQ